MFARELNSKMILQVHDELVFDVHADEKDILEKIVKESMEGALKLSVPLEVEYKIAGNWLDAH
jgi:DNA polymerase-1